MALASISTLRLSGANITLSQACHDPLTNPVLSSQRAESIDIVLPVSVEVHRSVQSPLEDGPAGGCVKLTHGTNSLTPGFMRPQVINVTAPYVSLLKRVLAIFQMAENKRIRELSQLKTYDTIRLQLRG